MRSASFQTGEARRALSTSGLTSTATTRPCLVIATSSPLSTRSSWAGRVSRAVLALIVGISKLYVDVRYWTISDWNRLRTRCRPGDAQ